MTLGTAARPRPARFHRLSAVLLASALPLTGVVALATSADAVAAPTLTVHAPTTKSVRPGTTAALSGLRLTSSSAGANVQVTLSTDTGTLSVGTTTGLTLAYGNSWTGDSSVSFYGVAADINTALASVSLTQSASDGANAVVSISAMPYQAGMIYAPPNEHFYEYVAASAISYDAAKTAAAARTFAGQTGYLATIPNAEINALITSKIPGAVNVWIGAESTDTSSSTPARRWKWAAGPLASSTFANCSNWTGACDLTPATTKYNSWATGEPNNYGGGSPGASAHSGEWAAVTNWMGGSGEWNDLPGSWTSGVTGYVVEYGDDPVGSSGFDGVVDDQSTIKIENSPLTAPRSFRAKAGDRVIGVTFKRPATTGGSAIRRYEYTLNSGRSWKRLTTTGTKTLTGTIGGVLNGAKYQVAIRAVNATTNGPSSTTRTVVTKSWFRDLTDPKAAAARIKVPSPVWSYRGRLKETVAFGTSYNGTVAFPARKLNGRQLQVRQAVSFSPGTMFANRSTRPSAEGRAEIRELARSLKYSKAVVCEGYTDHGGNVTNEKKIALERAVAVCDLLTKYGADVVTVTKGYGPERPWVVGGAPDSRDTNRRVVVLVTA